MDINVHGVYNVKVECRRLGEGDKAFTTVSLTVRTISEGYDKASVDTFSFFVKDDSSVVNAALIGDLIVPRES